MKEEVVVPSEVCHRAFELMKAKQFPDAEKLLSHHLSKTEDPTALALYHSSMGVLAKLQGDTKAAWRHYSRAEKFLPNDPALKIIMARLLIDEFAEYSAAIKRAKKVLELIPTNPVFVHQAYITMGLAIVKKGEKKKSVMLLQQSMVNDFAGFVTAMNIDFHLVEALLRKGWGKAECRAFVGKALLFAKQQQEENLVDTFQKMLNAMDPNVYR